ncbi:MAG TPA: AbgT family transporter [Clostridia bacterium]|nr:AbgT family transporter [Clostridia bacterium]
MLKRIPSSYVLLFYIIFILGIASYFIQAGTYEREVDINTGISYVVSNSYTVIEKTPVSFFEFFKAIPQGLMESSDIIMFVLIIGGSFGVIQATGTIDAFFGSLVRMYEGKEKILVIIIMTVFSLAGGILGTAEEALPFYPLVISVAIALGYDKMTGVAILLLGTGSGFAAGFLNPFTTGIAQNISELPMFSGMTLRIFAHIIFLTTAIVYLFRYTNKIEKEIENDINENNFHINLKMLAGLSNQQKRVAVTVIIVFVFLIVGILKYKFHILEIATTFFIMSILGGLVGGLKPGRISSEFVKGASNLIYGALIIGVANGVGVIMRYGNIMDPIIHKLAGSIEGFNPTVSLIGILVVNIIISLFISSGSGQAAATMPIMKTVADLSGVTRQAGVLAYQFGDGLTNIISPTSGYVIAALALADIEWRDWVKWFLPLYIIWLIEGVIILLLANAFNYGPF